MINNIPMYVYSKLSAKNRTNEVEEYAQKHNFDIIEIDKSSIKINPDFYNIGIKRNKNDTKSVVIYARFSSNNQREISITGQLDECLAYCEKENYTVTAIYVDMAQSGTNDLRTAFEKLNEDISMEKYNGFKVIIYTSSRFFRNRKKLSFYRCIYDTYYIELESVTQRYGKGRGAEFMRAADEIFDEVYSTDLADAVRRGMRQRSFQCKYTGGFVTYGYHINDETKLYEINEYEAENVRLIFDMYVNKKGYTEILQALDERGVVSRTGRPFSKNSISEILSNEKYIGVYTYGRRTGKDEHGKRNSHKYNEEKDVIRIPGGVPVIVDKDIFDLAQKRKEENKHGTKSRREKEDYLLTGLIYCKECGHAFTGNRRFSGRNKTKYVTYRCTNHNKGEKCNCKEVNRDYLEAFVIDTIENHILGDENEMRLFNDFRERQIKGNNEHNNRIASLKKEVAILETQRHNILTYIDKGIAADELLIHLQDKKNEIERTRAEIVALENSAPKLINEYEFKELMKATKETIARRSLPDLRRLIAFYVTKIEIGKDDIFVVLSYYNIVLQCGGGEGSRTPVRKTFLPTFYERSCLFNLVLFCGKQHPRRRTSPLMRDGIQGYFPCTFTAT